MRILIVRPGPAFSVADVYAGWLRAFRELGHDVRESHLDTDLTIFGAAEIDINGDRRRIFSQAAAYELAQRSIYAEAYLHWPDLIFLPFAQLVHGQTVAHLRSRKHKVVACFTESPYEDKTQIERAAQFDMCLVNDPTNLDRFRAANPRTYYQPHCYDPSLHSPGPALERLRSEFAFVGTGYPSRVEFLEQVDFTGIDAVLGGHWTRLPEESPLRKFLGHDIEECCDNNETVNIYRSTKMSANIYRREAERDELSEGWALSPREIELAAVGTFYASQPRGELAEVLPMVPTFTEPGELGDLIRYYLSHDNERDRVAGDARQAIEDRTFVNAAGRMFSELDRVPVVSA